MAISCLCPLGSACQPASFAHLWIRSVHCGNLVLWQTSPLPPPPQPKTQTGAGSDDPIRLRDSHALGCHHRSPGYADPIKFEDGGNPYGYSCTLGELDETGKKSAAFQAKRLVEFAQKLSN